MTDTGRFSSPLVIDARDVEVMVGGQDLDVGACRDAGALAQLDQLVDDALTSAQE